MPGLIDLHTHLIWSGGSDPVRTVEEEGIHVTLLRPRLMLAKPWKKESRQFGIWAQMKMPLFLFQQQSQEVTL